MIIKGADLLKLHVLLDSGEENDFLPIFYRSRFGSLVCQYDDEGDIYPETDIYVISSDADRKAEVSTTALIERWARERGLEDADPTKQMLKLAEEFGELAEGMAKNRPDQIRDSIGDMYVVLTILSLQLGLDIDTCIGVAYDEIKDRRGKLINGCFVKESDLTEGLDDGN